MLQSVFLKGILYLFTFTLLSFLACSGDSNLVDPDEDAFPDANLSFLQHIQPIFLQDCAAFGACHQSSVRANGLDLQSDVPDFFSSVNGPVVIPNNSNASLLIDVLLGPVQTRGIARMPKNAAALSESKITAIAKWIDEGANTAQ